jgi:hypothetical protein
MPTRLHSREYRYWRQNNVLGLSLDYVGTLRSHFNKSFQEILCTELMFIDKEW